MSYTRCSFCRLDICSTCVKAHPATHADMLQDMQYTMAFLYDKGSSKWCSSCKKSTRIPTRCSAPGCKWSVCSECFLKGPPVDHSHKSFTNVLAPNRGTMMSPIQAAGPCNGTRHIDHCNKCNKSELLLHDTWIDQLTVPQQYCPTTVSTSVANVRTTIRNPEPHA